MDEILENVMLGTYGVKPLSLGVAEDAIRHLSGQSIELEDKIVKIDVDERDRLIKFGVEVRRRAEEIPQPPAREEVMPGWEGTAKPEVEMHGAAFLELAPGFDAQDVRMRLTSLLQQYGASSIDLTLDVDEAAVSLTIRKPTVEVLERYKVMINLLSRLSKDKGRVVLLKAQLARPLTTEELAKVFGDYFRPRRSTFDRFLPA